MRRLLRAPNPHNSFRLLIAPGLQSRLDRQGYNSYSWIEFRRVDLGGRGTIKIKHAEIWTALDRLAAVARLSRERLAKKSGLDPTTFNKSKRITSDGRARWPSTESVAKALTATGTPIDTFVQLIEETGRSTAKKTVPLIGLAQADKDGYFDASGFPIGQAWEEIRFSGLDDEHAYALEISGDSMAPVYNDGTLRCRCARCHG